MILFEGPVTALDGLRFPDELKRKHSFKAMQHLMEPVPEDSELPQDVLEAPPRLRSAFQRPKSHKARRRRQRKREVLDITCPSQEELDEARQLAEAWVRQKGFTHFSWIPESVSPGHTGKYSAILKFTVDLDAVSKQCDNSKAAKQDASDVAVLQSDTGNVPKQDANDVAARQSDTGKAAEQDARDMVSEQPDSSKAAQQDASDEAAHQSDADWVMVMCDEPRIRY